MKQLQGQQPAGRPVLMSEGVGVSVQIWGLDEYRVEGHNTKAADRGLIK